MRHVWRFGIRVNRQTTILSLILVVGVVVIFGGPADSEQPAPIDRNDSTSDLDLYVVTLHNHAEAGLLSSSGAEAILRAGNDYVVLAGIRAVERFAADQLEYRLLARNVSKAELAVDHRMDRENLRRYTLLFERDNLRLLQIPDAVRESIEADPDLSSIDNKYLKIAYSDPVEISEMDLSSLAVDLDSLISLVEQDSVESYLYQLEALMERQCSSAPVRHWVTYKFYEIGYDSLYVDEFDVVIPPYYDMTFYNVVALKVGTVRPEHQIIVGAHHDGVYGSPAVDDNGTGVAGVLELARVLHGIETDVTFVFVTFDAEECGLFGAWHHANSAVINDDQIIFMFNMDMIGHLTNNNQARVYHGATTTYAQRWIDIGGPLVGIDGYLDGQSGYADHFPFDQN